MRPGEAGSIASRCTFAGVGPVISLAIAVIALEPSERAESVGTEKLQLPLESVVVVPSGLPSAKSSIVLPAFAVPVKVGVVLLVSLSELELPESVAASRAEIDGALRGANSCPL